MSDLLDLSVSTRFIQFEKKNTFVFRTDELSRHIDFPQIENLRT